MGSIRNLTPRQEVRREKILSATRKLVASQGFDGMVMSDVAEAACVSPTTLYNLYNTKDELLLEALRGLVVKNYEKVGQRFGVGSWRYLLGVVENGAWLRSAEPEYGEAITDALLRAKPGDPLTQLLFENVRQDFAYSLKQMKLRGELAGGVDPQHLAVILLGNYWGTFLLLNKGIEKSRRLIHSANINLLSVLIASTCGEVKKEMSDHILELRRWQREELKSD
ncbi:MAG: hypothetical protein CMQ40_02970 [Gammaproteobacteria bacterium]|nr:hypothetical protein [Gammaproteobacteria bacterium]|tara:strand:- start:513 stop:1184 length:672 start_codon:yes stop_codon:yes gene_type:complete